MGESRGKLSRSSMNLTKREMLRGTNQRKCRIALNRPDFGVPIEAEVEKLVLPCEQKLFEGKVLMKKKRENAVLLQDQAR